MDGTAASSAVGSFASTPAIASSMIAASATVRVIGPMWSSEPASSSTPWRLTRPQVGLRPTMPHWADGKRIDPPVSEPSEPKQRPAAVATPEPLDETPVHRPSSQGLTGMSKSGW